MGIRPQGHTLILGGTGPMGLLAIDHALHGPINPSLLVVTDTTSRSSATPAVITL